MRSGERGEPASDAKTPPLGTLRSPGRIAGWVGRIRHNSGCTAPAFRHSRAFHASRAPEGVFHAQRSVGPMTQATIQRVLRWLTRSISSRSHALVRRQLHSADIGDGSVHRYAFKRARAAAFARMRTEPVTHYDENPCNCPKDCPASSMPACRHHGGGVRLEPEAVARPYRRHVAAARDRSLRVSGRASRRARLLTQRDEYEARRAWSSETATRSSARFQRRGLPRTSARTMSMTAVMTTTQIVWPNASRSLELCDAVRAAGREGVHVQTE